MAAIFRHSFFDTLRAHIVRPLLKRQKAHRRSGGPFLWSVLACCHARVGRAFRRFFHGPSENAAQGLRPFTCFSGAGRSKPGGAPTLALRFLLVELDELQQVLVPGLGGLAPAGHGPPGCPSYYTARGRQSRPCAIRSEAANSRRVRAAPSTMGPRGARQDKIGPPDICPGGLVMLWSYL